MIYVRKYSIYMYGMGSQTLIWSNYMKTNPKHVL